MSQAKGAGSNPDRSSFINAHSILLALNDVALVIAWAVGKVIPAVSGADVSYWSGQESYIDL